MEKARRDLKANDAMFLPLGGQRWDYPNAIPVLPWQHQGPIFQAGLSGVLHFFYRHFSIVNEIFNKKLLASKALHF